MLAHDERAAARGERAARRVVVAEQGGEGGADRGACWARARALLRTTPRGARVARLSAVVVLRCRVDDEARDEPTAARAQRAERAAPPRDDAPPVAPSKTFARGGGQRAAFTKRRARILVAS